VASAVLLATVIARTACSPVPSWKGRPLISLLSGPDDDLREAAVDMVEQRNGVDKAVGRRRTRFRKTNNGSWQFQAVMSEDTDG